MLIRLEELSILLRDEKIYLKTLEILDLHQSLVSKDFCFHKSNLSKSESYQKLYDDHWLQEKIKLIKQNIIHWEHHHGVKTINLNDKNYPEPLLKLTNPPPCIFMMGTYDDKVPCVSIVGRREAKPYTLKWMEDEIAPVLKDLNLTVISGGARGVDTKAHQLALLNNCKTVYVMPSGLLQLYPANLASSAKKLIAEGACFISAYNPNEEMRKKNFSDRNLLIAALSSKILILEAEIRSGTYKTARYALDLGCDLGVVPSFPTDRSFSGSLQLMFDGAQMLRNSEDLKCFLSTP